ncbi:hypothetical protein GCK72_021894 [Caenorhabditis remanei]|uniref:Uncharacterized protein n=1 Tax=Caenorhabditis remanei TaxID=31234 RepID=A0A6A5GLA6_CAERE|nr:hypothetical protein GCK72_021894 [Caenorhabditis remanei]KAF1755325.1 hypothetical protein GCK72_021894 [Caenorhabditis remanei]
MKLLIPALLGLYHACLVVCDNHKIQTLSQDERQKLLDALNKDRQEIAKKIGIEFETLEYDMKCEQKVSKLDACEHIQSGESEFRLILLRRNDVTSEYIHEWNIYHGYDNPHSLLFWPSLDTICCSKSFKCSKKIPKTKRGSQLAGKQIEARGACASMRNRNFRGFVFDEHNKINNATIPPTSKYADIIGVPAIGDATTSGDSIEGPASSSGNKMNLIIIFFMVITFF